jgi:glycosyltransferase involved in cell wall biosynthesis
MVKTSVIIITIAPHPGLASLLHSVAADLPGAEIILVIDSDKADVHVMPHEGVKITYTQSRLGPGNARNTGASVATGENLVFIDSDIVPEKGSLIKMVECMQDADYVTGNIRYWKSANETPLMIYNRLKGYEKKELGKKYHYGQSGFLGIKKSAFMALKGFDTRLRSAEDGELGYRAVLMNLKLAFCVEAIAFHPPKTDREIYLSHLRNKAGRHKIASMHKDLYAWKTGLTELPKNIFRFFNILSRYRKNPFYNHPELSSSSLRKAMLALYWNDLKATIRILFLPDKKNIRYGKR